MRGGRCTAKLRKSTCAVHRSFYRINYYLNFGPLATHLGEVRRQSLSKRPADDVRCVRGYAGVSGSTLHGLTGCEAAGPLIGPNDCHRKQVLGHEQCDSGRWIEGIALYGVKHSSRAQPCIWARTYAHLLCLNGIWHDNQNIPNEQKDVRAHPLVRFASYW